MLLRLYEDKVCEGKRCERRNLKTKPAYNYALVPAARSPARHFKKVLTQQMEIQTPYPLPHILHVPVPDFHKLGPVKIHSSSLEETKQELRVLIIKNNNNKNKELRLSLGHMWGMMQRIKEVKLACMASAEESPGLHCGVGRKQKGLKLRRNSWCRVKRDLEWGWAEWDRRQWS